MSLPVTDGRTSIREHNCNISGACDTFNTFGGRLTYLGSPFGSSVDPGGILPTTECCGNANFFSAANMQGAVPEPSTWALMLIGFAGIGYMAFRRAKKAKRPRLTEYSGNSIAVKFTVQFVEYGQSAREHSFAAYPSSRCSERCYDHAVA